MSYASVDLAYTPKLPEHLSKPSNRSDENIEVAALDLDQSREALSGLKLGKVASFTSNLSATRSSSPQQIEKNPPPTECSKVKNAPPLLLGLYEAKSKGELIGDDGRQTCMIDTLRVSLIAYLPSGQGFHFAISVCVQLSGEHCSPRVFCSCVCGSTVLSTSSSLLLQRFKTPRAPVCCTT